MAEGKCAGSEQSLKGRELASITERKQKG